MSTRKGNKAGKKRKAAPEDTEAVEVVDTAEVEAGQEQDVGSGKKKKKEAAVIPVVGDNWQALTDDLWDIKAAEDQLKSRRPEAQGKRKGLVEYLQSKGEEQIHGLGTDGRFALRIREKHAQPTTMSILQPVLIEFMRAHDNRLPNAKELKVALAAKKKEMCGPAEYDLRWVDTQAEEAKKEQHLRKVLAKHGFSEHARVVDTGTAVVDESREGAQRVAL
jgi:hypothetical protein